MKDMISLYQYRKLKAKTDIKLLVPSPIEGLKLYPHSKIAQHLLIWLNQMTIPFS
jgi:hypothetical protein